jgi:CRISPR/Cas system-associated exonuclease Cas4 (RecB family)
MPQSSDVRILSAIVHHMQSVEDDPLTALIDEYLIKREQPEYANLRIWSVTLPLVDRPRPGGRISPSSVCGCERQAAMKFVGVQGRTRIDPDEQLIFEDGKWRHHKWQTMFREMEQILGRDRFRVVSIEEPIVIDKLYIAGHLDAVIKIKVKKKWRRYVIDIKGANEYAWENAYQKQAPDPKYVRQIITYAKAKGIKRAILLYESKNRNKFYCFAVTVTPELWAEVQLWAKRIIEQVQDRKLPPMHPECHNGTFLYNKCPYKSMCFGKLTPRQLERKVYRDFDSIDAAWERGHDIVEAHAVPDDDV